MASATGWPSGWGPSHQDQRKRTSPFRIWIGFWFAVWLFEWDTLVGALVIFGGAYLVWFIARVLAIRWAELDLPQSKVAEGSDPVDAVQEQARRYGGGLHLGSDEKGRWRFAPPERALLVLGPPRSGKTQGVIVPALLSHSGPAVSTSTKPDVLIATVVARSRNGEVWQFDPTGVAGVRVGRALRWSPVTGCGVWDDALLMARAMVLGSGVGEGTTDATHWAKRAQALLASLLHAAVAGERDIACVLEWVVRHELDEPGMLLERRRGAPQAISLLRGLANTEGRERSSIFSAAADALDAYASYGALDAAREPNFDAARFVRSHDTVYIHAPAEHQAAVAPLVCGLLPELAFSGAVPVILANFAAVSNLAAPAVSPIALAALSAPQPGRASSSGRYWATSSTSSLCSSPIARVSSRIAALATASASIGSDFPGSRALLRAPAISFGGILSTRSPRASRNRSKRPLTCRQSSTAQTRPLSRPRAQASSWPCPPSRAAAVRVRISRPVSSSTAAHVWVRLCASTPITIMSTVPSYG